jgi:prepilin-type N-terminal cleavage/methylation domain-containing protein
MRASRSGFTLIEMLIVVSLMGLMGMLAFPRMHAATNSMSVRSARQQAAEMLIVARGSAVRSGADSRFIRSGNVLRVIVDSSGTFVTVAARDLYTSLGVTVEVGGTAPRDTVRFSPRGQAIGLTGPATIRFTNGSSHDSVCVSKLGKVARAGCVL